MIVALFPRIEPFTNHPKVSISGVAGCLTPGASNNNGDSWQKLRISKKS
jgi:hypothetical protein